jgi:hypothetical protein
MYTQEDFWGVLITNPQYYKNGTQKEQKLYSPEGIQDIQMMIKNWKTI